MWFLDVISLRHLPDSDGKAARVSFTGHGGNNGCLIGDGEPSELQVGAQVRQSFPVWGLNAISLVSLN